MIEDYINIDKVVNRVSAKQLAEYILVNYPNYADELIFELESNDFLDSLQSEMKIVNDELITNIEEKE